MCWLDRWPSLSMTSAAPCSSSATHSCASTTSTTTAKGQVRPPPRAVCACVPPRRMRAPRTPCASHHVVCVHHVLCVNHVVRHMLVRLRHARAYVVLVCASHLHKRHTRASYMYVYVRYSRTYSTLFSYVRHTRTYAILIQTARDQHPQL